ncbi:Protein HIRA [Aphelenchoides fujianensis]|nr:Protein HIRA [Aphelenchoides fujianensis]
MHIYKCGKVDYQDGQIYSLDVHPNGRWLATGGSSGSNGLLSVWNLEFVLADDPSKRPPAEKRPPHFPADLLMSEDENSQTPGGSQTTEQNAKPPVAPLVPTAKVDDRTDRESEKWADLRICHRILYSSTQNCVRWSRADGGRFLAAAGDSALKLFELARLSGEEDGGRPKFELRDAFTLCGHRMEVQHLEFSYDGRYLASCSLDSSVIVWDVERLPNALVVLNADRDGHRDHVTGLAWDPLERFLATQSSDKTLKIWRCDLWTCDQTISAPFTHAPTNSLFRRMDWTADGSLLIAPCATKSGFHTAKVVMRKGYDQTRDLVGFRDTVSCVRSSSTCLRYKTPDGVEKTLNCVAVGAMDRSLSLWLLPGFSRPLCVLQNFFPGALLDMTWWVPAFQLHGNTLAVVGINAGVRCLRLNEAEIGKFLTRTEMAAYLQALYNHVPRERQCCFEEEFDDPKEEIVLQTDGQEMEWISDEMALASPSDL